MSLERFGKSKDGRYLYKAECETCKADRGFVAKKYLIRKCRSCSAKDASKDKAKPKEYVTNKAKSKYNNVDFEDFKRFPSGGKIYRIACVGCGGDRGYHALSAAFMQCRPCMGKALSAKTSPNIIWSEHIDGASHRRKYKQFCLSCGSDCGYRELKQFDSPCPACKANGVKRVRENRKRIKSSMKSSIYHRLKYRLADKSRKKTFDLLDFTLDDLISHLESLFQPGMTWDNYGEWHIDHKIPDSWFLYNSVSHPEFKKSWSLDNLQPKWAKENISKGNRFAD